MTMMDTLLGRRTDVPLSANMATIHAEADKATDETQSDYSYRIGRLADGVQLSEGDAYLVAAHKKTLGKSDADLAADVATMQRFRRLSEACEGHKEKLAALESATKAAGEQLKKAQGAVPAARIAVSEAQQQEKILGANVGGRAQCFRENYALLRWTEEAEDLL